MRKWKALERRVLEEDTKSINIDIPNTQEVMVVFYGRENNTDDTMANTNGADSVRINDTGVINCVVTYVRPRGTNFHTFIYAKVINGYLDGCVKPKGNKEQYNFSSTIVNMDSIHSMTLTSNNYFKKESWIEIYYT